jgi:hypothetical protein
LRRRDGSAVIGSYWIGRIFIPGRLSELSWENLEYTGGQIGSFRQMQTCMGKIGFLHTRAAAEVSIDGLPALDRHARARARRCLLHIFAMLRRPRTVQFQWEGIVRELRGVETQICRPPQQRVALLAK